MSHLKDEDYKLTDSSYGWFLRSFNMLEKALSLNIQVHDDEDLLNKGQIFLFNHFARFETIIPPYIIYNETGKFCRSIADSSLFANDKLAKILKKGGAVPNNLPGLLPFLAAEILKGRKIVIFPEGGMVKDRRVIDAEGQFNIFSSVSNKNRKHHKGAAVLALTLDLFKRRIRDLFEDGDHERIAHWQESLGLTSPEELLRQAQKPTLIVPSNITFHPIRITDNTLTKTVNFFSKNVSKRMAEETAIEGNILFEDTDMDIRFTNPITTHTKWNWWRKALLRNYFLSIDSLDELFGLRETSARNWSEKFLIKTIVKNTTKLRDLYMESIYKGTTINLGHIASGTIFELLKNGTNKIDRYEFHRILYIVLKQIQNETGIYLHRALIKPNTPQENVLHGESPDLKVFIETCIHAELVEIQENNYVFKEKLLKEFKFHEVRIENPVLVSANEIAPINEVGKAIKYAVKKAKNITKQELATHMFDDELRLFAWQKKFYSVKKYKDLNKRETATADPKPYMKIPKNGKKVGILFVHGFLSSPAELKEFADKMYDKNYPVLGVRLSGHGTSPYDLDTRKWQEWLDSTRRGYRILSAFVDEIIVVGFSAGGLLSILLAGENLKKLAGVACVAAPMPLNDKGVMLIPALNTVNKIASYIPAVDGITPFLNNDTAHPDINYQTMSVSAINQLKTLVSVTKKKLKDITVPITILQATDDPDASPKSGDYIFKHIGSKQKDLHLITSNRHGLITDNIGDTHKILIDFIETFNKK